MRIVGVQRSERAGGEFVLLQNQGAMRLELRGHAVLACDAPERLHVFGDRETIPAGTFVMLTTGPGTSRWAVTKDGQRIYHVYMGRERALWAEAPGPISVMAVQHTFSPRREVSLA